MAAASSASQSTNESASRPAKRPSPVAVKVQEHLIKCDWIGFDLDHTLITYKHEELNDLVYDCLVRYLVEHAHYTSDLKNVPRNRSFCKKGIILDRQRGNLLKLAKDAWVETAYHGTKRLSDAQITEIYGETRKVNFEGHTNKEFWSMTTAFEVTVAPLFATLVDWQDERPAGSVSTYYTTYLAHAEALYDGILFNFAEWDKGYYFQPIVDNPARFIHKQDKVKEWLKLFRVYARSHGGNPRLFLVTNSLPEYTELLMAYAFGADWESLFDVIVTWAKKPFFFTENRDFFEWEFVSADRRKVRLSNTPASTLSIGGRYIGGNASALSGAFRRLHPSYRQGAESGTKLRVCYFGDHVYYDVVAPKEHKWTTVAIVEELAEETDRVAEALKRIRIAAAPRGNDMSTVATAGGRSPQISISPAPGSENEIDESDTSSVPDVKPQPIEAEWGSYFSTAAGGITFWHNYIIKHSEFCIASLEYLANEVLAQAQHYHSHLAP